MNKHAELTHALRNAAQREPLLCDLLVQAEQQPLGQRPAQRRHYCWSTAEVAIVKANYSQPGGPEKCRTLLPGRTASGIFQQARKQGLNAARLKAKDRCVLADGRAFFQRKNIFVKLQKALAINAATCIIQVMGCSNANHRPGGSGTPQKDHIMKVITLRTLKTLPAAYAGVSEFFVRIAGQKTLCKTLADAQRATAGFPQETTVTFMGADASAIKSVMPVQVAGKGWDVRTRYADGREELLCGGAGAYTLAQAQVAADGVRRNA